MEDIIRTPENYTERSIKNAYDRFLARVKYLEKLDNAYMTGLTGTERHPYTVNNLKNIADTKSSYIAGIPPTYSADDGDEKGSAIIELYSLQVKGQLDQQIANGCSIYGRDFEVCYCEREQSEDGTVRIVPKSVESSPLNTFVAYDQSLNPDSVFGAIHYTETDDAGVEHHFLDIYDRTDYVRYALADGSTAVFSEIPGTRRPHGFDRVPIIEYKNNPNCEGDFVPVLSLQRALNEILGDRVHDKNRFASATLISKGFHLGDTQEEVEESMGTLKEDQYVSIPRDSDMYYLTKTFDEASVQVLVDYIDAQMHKISGVPDMTDEQFASNASGVAIRYKLLSLNNLAQSFVSQFERGFLRRCKLYSYALFGESGADVARMRTTFRFNIPNDSSYDAQTMEIYMRNNALSRKTMMENCPYIDDVEEEERRIQAEADMADERNARAEADTFQEDGFAYLGTDEV